MGDSFLVEFPSALGATESAVEIQKGLAKYNEDCRRGKGEEKLRRS